MAEEVEALPCLQFTVKLATLTASSSGTQRGILELVCVVRDEAMWEAAVAKMDGYSVFESTMDEILDAMGLELTEQTNEAASLKRVVSRLRSELAAKEEKLQKLTNTLAVLETDLGF